jgi:phosphoadenosine phosphosulfate reductase
MSAGLPELKGDDPGARLQSLRAAVDGRILFTTSFGLEDQAITHLIFSLGLEIEVATLDTGRLFPATYRLWQEVEELYGKRIGSFHPDAPALAALVADAGINGFYHSRAARLDCCTARKVEPLRHALAGASAWVTGLRRSQSSRRAEVQLSAWDEEHRLLKVAPLFDWTRDAVAEFCRSEQVPINPLHAENFLSIGCEPCTRAVRAGEDERSGRWWWERGDVGECGLHPAGEARRPAA